MTHLPSRRSKPARFAAVSKSPSKVRTRNEHASFLCGLSTANQHGTSRFGVRVTFQYCGTLSEKPHFAFVTLCANKLLLVPSRRKNSNLAMRFADIAPSIPMTGHPELDAKGFLFPNCRRSARSTSTGVRVLRSTWGSCHRESATKSAVGSITGS